jgi:Uma2 family endonuclease
MTPALATAEPIVYPEDDGNPMAENTLQFEWIVTIKGGLDAVFAHNDNVFVAGDLLWYPVEGQPKICQAPDTMVVFGRPKGHRSSYLQWEEGGIGPRVVFEVLSPGNRLNEMIRKFQFYEEYRVEEYYVFDPYKIELCGWLCERDRLRSIPVMNGWKSPLLNVRFELADNLRVYGPDGRSFATYVELAELRKQAEREKERAEREKERAEHEKERAEHEKERAERDREAALRHAEEQARLIEKLQAQLKAASINPET